MSAYGISYLTGSPWLGVLAAGVTGALLGALHAGICSLPRVNDIAVGIALMLFGTGLAFYLGKPLIEPTAARLPAIEALAEALAANGAKDAATEAKRADFTGQGTILLVEDEEGLRSLNARGLRSRGYSVIEASNGIEAMEALEEKNGAVDLVVSDVVMPEMDGPTLLKAMRERNPDLKIIFVSGYAEDAFDKSVLRDDEQFAFLPKPFALSALVEKVKQTMGPS